MPPKRQWKKGKRKSASRGKRMAVRNAAAPKLRFPEVDLENPAEVAAFNKELQRKAGERIHAAVKKLKNAGIIDERGRRISKELPPDMRPGSRCRLPG